MSDVEVAEKPASLKSVNPERSNSNSPHPSNENFNSATDSLENSPKKKKEISPIQWDMVESANRASHRLKEKPIHVAVPEKQPQTVKSTTSSSNSTKESSALYVHKRLRSPHAKADGSVFSNACYFLIKSINFDNIQTARTEDAWATTLTNESRFARAFREYDNVLFIFSVCESVAFQGYARMSNMPDRNLRINWELPRGMHHTNLSYSFPIEWLAKKELPFGSTSRILNLWNEHKPVKIGRDGQEIDPKAGEELCRMFDTPEAQVLTDQLLIQRKQEEIDRRRLRQNVFERSRPDRLHSNQSNSYISSHSSRSGKSTNGFGVPQSIDSDAAMQAALLFNASQSGGAVPASTVAIAPNTLQLHQLAQSLASAQAAQLLSSAGAIPSINFNIVQPPSTTTTSLTQSRYRSPRSPKRRHRRSRSRSAGSSLDRIEQLDYEEYLRQASKGISLFPSKGVGAAEPDKSYDKKVEAFLRGIHKRSNSRSRSQSFASRSRSRSRGLAKKPSSSHGKKDRSKRRSRSKNNYEGHKSSSKSSSRRH